MIWLSKLNFLAIGWIPGVGWWASTRYQRTRQSINAGSDQTRAFLLHHSHHLLQASSCSYPHSISPDSMQSCRSAILTMYFKRAQIKKTDCSLSLRFAHDKIFVQIIWRGLHWSIRRLRCTQSRASFLTNSEGLVLTIPYNCHFFYTDTIFVRIKFTPKNATFLRKICQKCQFFALNL